MSRSDEERVADIIEAAEELAAVTSAGRDAFLSSRLRIRAGERTLEIIGEASNGLSDEFKLRHQKVPWRDVGALRILLAHHYHRSDASQVWQIATVAVPELVQQLTEP